MLAVDCLGVQLGSRGPLTLIQVGTYSGHVYLSDVLQNKKLIHDGKLDTLLESEAVIKVCYDFTLRESFFFISYRAIALAVEQKPVYWC